MKRFGALIPGILAGAIALGAFSLGFFGGPERFFEDLLFSARIPDSRIVIVAIDNQTLEALGQWPLSRAIYGTFIEKLTAHPPKALGIDILMSEPSRGGKGDDLALARALQNASFPIIMPAEANPLTIKDKKPEAGGLIVPLSLFQASSVSLGHVNLITDPDGVVRTIPFDVRSAPEAFSSVVIGKNPGGTRRIAYTGPPGTIPRYALKDVLEQTTLQESLAGKYVFLGATASDLHDEQLTAFSRGVPMSGVEIQAQVGDMILQNSSLIPLPRSLAMLWVLLAALLASLPFFFIRSAKRAFIASLLTGIIHAPLAIILFEQGWIPNILHVHLSWALGVLAAVLYRHLVSEKESRMMRQAFGKYVSKDVLEEILKDTTKIKLGGEERNATIFFSDVRGFTTLSESLSPTELTTFLNRYLTRMTDIALEERGVVDKYIGDAIMVFWGAPLENLKHPDDAVHAALRMTDALDAFNKESEAQGDPKIDIGIGMNTGDVVVGNMGSNQRFDYTVMGDAVNLASRLEGQTKTYGIRILVNESTASRITDPSILMRRIDRIRVKGKHEPVAIYEIIERKKESFVRSILTDFEKLRAAYEQGDWNAVIREGAAILEKGEDGPTKTLVERAKYFKEHPPEQWEGVYDMKTK